MVTRRFVDAMLTGSTYVFPLAAFPLLTWAWWDMGGWRLAAFLMGVPLAFGYLMPGVGTNVMKRWRFTGGWRIGNFYAHHGIIYSSKLAFALWLAMHEPAAIDSTLDAIAVVLIVGGIAAFGGWWHDLYAIRTGRIELVDTSADGRDAETILTSFAPALYWTLGATYAAVGVLGTRALAADPSSFAAVFVAGLVALCVVPSLAFLALDPSAYRSFRDVTRRTTDDR